MNVLPSCIETEHSQQEVLTLTQMSFPVTTDTDTTQHPDITRPGNASKRADSAQKQLDRTPPPTRLHLSPLSAFLRRITRLTTQRELRTPRVPAIQQQRAPASQLEARARSRDVPTAAYVTQYGAHSLNPKTRALPQRAQPLPNCLCDILKNSWVMCSRFQNWSQPYAGSTPFATVDPVCRPTCHVAVESP